MKKLPNTISEEELLKAISQISNEDPDYTGDTDVLAFFSFYKIESGPNPVPKTLLYRLYRKWSKNPLNASSFSREVSCYIQYRQIRNKVYYDINLSSLEVGSKTYELLKDKRVDKTKSIKWKKHFEHFLEENNVKKGNTWVELFVVYALYDKWRYSQTRKKNILGTIQFSKLINLYFKDIKRDGSGTTLIALDDSILSHFTPESLSRIRKSGYEKIKNKFKRKNKTKKKAEQTEPGQICIPETGIQS